MSILRRLFGLSDSRAHVARRPRVMIGPLHRVEFIGPSGMVRVVNVSPDGIGLFRNDAPDARAGQVIEGVLTIAGKPFSVAVEVRHVSPSVVGLRFKDVSAALNRAIEDYFRIEIVALKLRQMNPEFMKQDPEGTPVWFTDGRLNELYYVVKDGELKRFHMSFLGHYLEGGPDAPVRSGFAPDESEEARGNSGQRAPLVDLGREASRQALELGQQLLVNVVALPAADLISLQAILARKGEPRRFSVRTE